MYHLRRARRVCDNLPPTCTRADPPSPSAQDTHARAHTHSLTRVHTHTQGALDLHRKTKHDIMRRARANKLLSQAMAVGATLPLVAGAGVSASAQLPLILQQASGNANTKLLEGGSSGE